MYGDNYIGVLGSSAADILVPLAIRLFVGRIAGPDISDDLVNVFTGVKTVKDFLDNVGNVTSLPPADLKPLQDVLHENGLHLMEPGETLDSVAARLSVNLDFLRECNIKAFPQGNFATGGLIYLRVKEHSCLAPLDSTPALEQKQGFLLDYTDGTLYTMGETPATTYILADRSPEAQANASLTPAQIEALAAKYRAIDDFIYSLGETYHNPDYPANAETMAGMDHVMAGVPATSIKIYQQLMVKLTAYIGTAQSRSYTEVSGLMQQLGSLAGSGTRLFARAAGTGVPDWQPVQEQCKSLLVQFATGAQALARNYAAYTGDDYSQKLLNTQNIVVSTASAVVTLTDNLGLGLSSNDLANRLVQNAVFSLENFSDNLAGYIALLQKGIALANWRPGTSGFDTYNGTAAREIITGYNGADTLRGFGGGDVIIGGAGDDLLDGGASVDQLTGGDGKDVFKFSALADSLYTNGQMDYITDFMIGQDKIDVTGLGFTGVTTGTAAAGQLKISYDSYYKQTYVRDLVSGFGFYIAGNMAALTSADFTGLILPGTHVMTGTSGNDALNGSAVNDIMTGLAGADLLTGGAGDDVLDGGAGIDQLTGGTGADIFRFSSLADSLYPNAMDRIADFVIGTDKIDLTGLGFTGVSLGTMGPGMLKIRYDAYYRQTYIYDTSGSGFGFYLAGDQSSLQNSDFIGLQVPSSYVLTGTAGNDTLTGSAASDTLNGLSGNDALYGGLGNDVYMFGRGYGSDTLFDNDGSAGNSDSLNFAAGTAPDQIWFRKSGSDLLIQIIGTADKVTISGWYNGNANRIEQIQTASGNILLDSKVQNLVNAMAGLAMPATTTMSQSYHSQLDPVIAANWT